MTGHPKWSTVQRPKGFLGQQRGELFGKRLPTRADVMPRGSDEGLSQAHLRPDGVAPLVCSGAVPTQISENPPRTRQGASDLLKNLTDLPEADGLVSAEKTVLARLSA